MGDITVDDIPDAAYAALPELAARAGVPPEYVVRRHILAWARLSDPAPGITGPARPPH